MRGWLARASASTIRRGEGHTVFARWARTFSTTGPVDDDLFRGDEDPYPRHWRQSPEPWPPGFTGADLTRQQLLRTFKELPPSWHAVAYERDVAGRDAAEVAAELGLTVDQEQRILNQARAALRTSLADLFARRDTL